MLKVILDWLGGGVVKQFTEPLLAAYQARLAAQNDAERLEAEQAITRIEAARDIAVTEAGRAWSATSVGRWLIVPAIVIADAGAFAARSIARRP